MRAYPYGGNVWQYPLGYSYTSPLGYSHHHQGCLDKIPLVGFQAILHDIEDAWRREMPDAWGQEGLNTTDLPE